VTFYTSRSNDLKGYSGTKCYRKHDYKVKLATVYSDKCFTRPATRAWCKKFARGTELVHDRKWPGQKFASDVEVQWAVH